MPLAMIMFKLWHQAQELIVQALRVERRKTQCYKLEINATMNQRARQFGGKRIVGFFW